MTKKVIIIAVAVIIASAGVFGIYTLKAEARGMATQNGPVDCSQICIEWQNNGSTDNVCLKWVNQCFRIDGTSYISSVD